MNLQIMLGGSLPLWSSTLAQWLHFLLVDFLPASVPLFTFGLHSTRLGLCFGPTSCTAFCSWHLLTMRLDNGALIAKACANDVHHLGDLAIWWLAPRVLGSLHDLKLEKIFIGLLQLVSDGTCVRYEAWTPSSQRNRISSGCFRASCRIPPRPSVVLGPGIWLVETPTTWTRICWCLGGTKGLSRRDWKYWFWFVSMIFICLNDSLEFEYIQIKSVIVCSKKLAFHSVCALRPIWHLFLAP